MVGIATHPYTNWQKSRPIPIPELKNCDPSEWPLPTRHFLGVNPPPPGLMIYDKFPISFRLKCLWNEILGYCFT